MSDTETTAVKALYKQGIKKLPYSKSFLFSQTSLGSAARFLTVYCARGLAYIESSLPIGCKIATLN